MAASYLIFLAFYPTGDDGTDEADELAPPVRLLFCMYSLGRGLNQLPPPLCASVEIYHSLEDDDGDGDDGSCGTKR